MEGPCEASDVARPEMAIPAGIDMSLAFVARQNGEEAAKQVATYLEYSGDYRLQLLLHIPESDSRLCTEFLLKNPFRPLGVTCAMNQSPSLLVACAGIHQMMRSGM